MHVPRAVQKTLFMCILQQWETWVPLSNILNSLPEQGRIGRNMFGNNWSQWPATLVRFAGIVKHWKVLKYTHKIN
jgi:hypothetical protein